MRSRTFLILALAALTSCTPVSSPSRETARPRELVVATTTDSPPYATGRRGELAGLEVDLAYEVGKALGRPVRIIDMRWEDLFEALSDGRIDVVMAGVTITPERELRFAFTDPYLVTRIVALVRRSDRKRFASPDAVCKSAIDVGVMGGTTGELYVRERCPSIIAREYRSAPDAVSELRTRRIDAVVHDGPVLGWLLAQNSADLELVPTRIGDQRLAWAVRRDDPETLAALDRALDVMRSDGTLDRVIRQWVPQVERVRAR